MSEELAQGREGAKSSEEKWGVLEGSILAAAEKVLGREGRRHPDWFQENRNELETLVRKRNRLFSVWLSSGLQEDRERYVIQRRLVAQRIRCAKNVWFQRKSRQIEHEIERGVCGRGVWQGLRDIQRGRAGLKPTRTSVVRDENGDVCEGPDAILSRWHSHFSSILNIPSSSDDQVFEEVQQRPVRTELAGPPDDEELFLALGKLKGRKAAGGNGILPEMIKCGGTECFEHMLELFQEVWKEQHVPAGWRDALIVPIPKKGDLTMCDNWRGISLLDVTGKVFARILQERLQSVVEDQLPDSQCGFRKGRGCVDMLYCARQLVEKTYEHNTKMFLLFVDLRKAYDSVPRQAMWKTLRKYGVPPVMVEVIKSLHDNMKAEVMVNGDTSPPIQVNNGLRQGCTIAPTLFNLYFNLVIEQWREKCRSIGVEVLYKCSGKLVGTRTRSPARTSVTELMFADDACAVTTSREHMEQAVDVLVQVTSQWGLTVSTPKTKLMVIGEKLEEIETAPIQTDGGDH